jgi:Putative peptidoglycan binding domain
MTRHWRRAPWVIAVAGVLVAGGVGVAIAKPFTSVGGPGAADDTGATGTYMVARQNLSSQTQEPATLGYAGAYTIAAPSGTSAQDIAQAQRSVTADRDTLSADEKYESDQATADNQAVAADQANVTTGRSALGSDQATESRDCAGSGAASSACDQAEQEVSQDRNTLAQAQQQLATARSTATLDRDQNQAKVQSDETTLQADQAILASDRATAVNPGTAYTWLPGAGEVIRQDQRVYAVSGEPVPLLYGPVTAYRAFYVGMSGGGDVAELTRDLIALGYGDGLARSDHYSTATAAAVRRWQKARGLPVTGEILLGEVVFEPGPIRVTSVTPSVGASVGSSGGSSDGEAGGGGGGTVLTATSTTRQVSIDLDASDQSEVTVGDKVAIALPSNQTTPGVISSVGTVATGGQNGGSPAIAVRVRPTDPAATGTWDQASVTVTITTGTVTNALVVPVAALRAQPGQGAGETGGGYAVEVVGAAGLHHLVAVNLGLFDDAEGMVQVTGTSLTVGQRVVVPKL